MTLAHFGQVGAGALPLPGLQLREGAAYAQARRDRVEPLRFAEGDAAFGMLERTPKAPVHRGRSSAPKAVFGHFLSLAKGSFLAISSGRFRAWPTRRPPPER